MLQHKHRKKKKKKGEKEDCFPSITNTVVSHKTAIILLFVLHKSSQHPAA